MLIFEILIDNTFADVNSDLSLTPIGNKSVLSIINDFEDGTWRYQKFQEFIWNNITETALSVKERNSLIEKPFTSLTEAAKMLRLTDATKDDKGQGSELAEIVLYGIMKHHYNALPVVPKIFYKQNAQDFAKGSDSVHIVLDGDRDFSLWFGEAKFYNSIEDVRLDAIVQSVENSLQTDKLKKENSIITNVSDIDNLTIDVDLKKRIKELLSTRESIDNLKPKLNIPILLLHECKLTQKQTILSDEYKKAIKAYHIQRAESYFKKQIAKMGGLHMYSEISFHIILFPVPVKETIVKKFVEHVDHLKKK
jgi:hypothetical protein